MNLVEYEQQDPDRDQSDSDKLPFSMATYPDKMNATDKISEALLSDLKL